MNCRLQGPIVPVESISDVYFVPLFLHCISSYLSAQDLDLSWNCIHEQKLLYHMLDEWKAHEQAS